MIITRMLQRALLLLPIASLTACFGTPPRSFMLVYLDQDADTMQGSGSPGIATIAPGSKLPVLAQLSNKTHQLELREVGSQDESIARARRVDATSLEIEGVSPGVVKLVATARISPGDKTLQEELTVIVSPIAHVKMHHLSAPQGATNAHYLTEQRVDLGAQLRDAEDRLHIGLGPAPVEVSPSGAARLLPDPPQLNRLSVQTGKTPGVVTLRATTQDHTSVTMTLVSPDALDGAMLQRTQPYAVGQPMEVSVMPTASGEPVAQVSLDKLEVSSNAPQICTIAIAPERFTSPGAERSWVRVEGLQAGTCEVETRYQHSVTGQTITTRHTLTIAAP